VLRIKAQIDNNLPENKRGDFSNKLELSRLVELTGQRSNEFEEDLSSAIKHLDVID